MFTRVPRGRLAANVAGSVAAASAIVGTHWFRGCWPAIRVSVIDHSHRGASDRSSEETVGPRLAGIAHGRSFGHIGPRSLLSEKTHRGKCLSSLVPGPGIEPGRPYGHGILSPERLPVPPPRLASIVHKNQVKE